jgi:hypothetical protein
MWHCVVWQKLNDAQRNILPPFSRLKLELHFNPKNAFRMFLRKAELLPDYMVSNCKKKKQSLPQKSQISHMTSNQLLPSWFHFCVFLLWCFYYIFLVVWVLPIFLDRVVVQLLLLAEWTCVRNTRDNNNRITTQPRKIGKTHTTKKPERQDKENRIKTP